MKRYSLILSIKEGKYNIQLRIIFLFIEFGFFPGQKISCYGNYIKIQFVIHYRFVKIIRIDNFFETKNFTRFDLFKNE